MSITGGRAAALPAAAVLTIAVGAAASIASGPAVGAAVWFTGLVITGAPVVWRTIRAARYGHFATDLIAMLAIVTAVLLREPLAGLVIVLMQTGGEALERFAAKKASRAVEELEAASPRQAHRVEGDAIVDVAASSVIPGNILLVRPGELIACDGEVVEGRSSIDTSRITGEPLPQDVSPGSRVLSGTLNGDAVIRMRATARAADSQYARIVDLVRSAQASKAPLQRLADRYAVWFTPVTLAVCALVLVTTRDWQRVLAVLVVATPCPLILATPIAIIGGINRAARRQIIIRNGAALERLSAISVMVFDKTGTLTVGRPAVDQVEALAGFDEREVLSLAAAVETGSSHPLARVIVQAAAPHASTLPRAQNIIEVAGRGVSGDVEGRNVHVGSRSYVRERIPDAARAAVPADVEGLRSYVAVDDRIVGIIRYGDALRPELSEVLRRIARLGVGRTLLLSGDHAANARAVAAAVGIADVRGDLLPGDKADVVRQIVKEGEVVAMVGDGTNDAPALSTADVGIALAGHGGGITTEAADVILLVDELDRVADSVEIGHRTIAIARQSIWAGLGLSGLAMLAASAGYIAPVQGALLQEAIDVAVILNALRASR